MIALSLDIVNESIFFVKADTIVSVWERHITLRNGGIAMKKLLVGMLAVCMAAVMTGCGDRNNSATQNSTAPEATMLVTAQPDNTTDTSPAADTTDDSSDDMDNTDNSDNTGKDGSVSDDIKRGVDDVGDGVKDAVDGVDDAIDDTVDGVDNAVNGTNGKN